MNKHRINTNRLYIVDVYRIIESKIDWGFENTTLHAKGMFARKTVVYDIGYGAYYDLITEKNLSVGLHFSSVGSEYVQPKSFISFNEYLNNQKENLSTRKIKKLYIEHKNNGNNK